MKLLFLTLYSENFPSTWFRVYQYLPYLKKKGIDFKVYPAVPPKWEKYYFGRNKSIQLFFFLGEVLKRMRDITLSSNWEIVFLQKGLTQVNFKGLDKLLFSIHSKVVFDFDDAVYSGPAQKFNHSLLSSLQDFRQVDNFLKHSRIVIAGNRHLAEYARKYNPHTKVIPTPIDTEKYTLKKFKIHQKEVIVGWSGSSSTNQYLNLLAGVLSQLAKKYPIKLRIMSNSLKNIHREKFHPLEIEFAQWKREREIEVIKSFDIGIMPIENDEWSKGKCGLKALQYMAVGVPCVISPVGVNKEIVEDGKNGFLAQEEREWEEKLSSLIENPALRKEFGVKGREKVEEKYSVRKNAPELISTLEGIL